MSFSTLSSTTTYFTYEKRHHYINSLTIIPIYVIISYISGFLRSLEYTDRLNKPYFLLYSTLCSQSINFPI